MRSTFVPLTRVCNKFRNIQPRASGLDARRMNKTGHVNTFRNGFYFYFTLPIFSSSFHHNSAGRRCELRHQHLGVRGVGSLLLESNPNLLASSSPTPPGCTAENSHRFRRFQIRYRPHPRDDCKGQWTMHGDGAFEDGRASAGGGVLYPLSPHAVGLVTPAF